MRGIAGKHRMRAEYSDPETRTAVYGLLDTAFDRLSARIRIAEQVGAVWHEVSTPFVVYVDGVPAAHVGVIEIPMMVAGKTRSVAGVHAVCTRPAHRGRGLGRLALEEALAYIDARYDLAILATGIPEYYAPFGFRAVAETVFEIEPPGDLPAAAPPRPISASVPADVRRVRELLARREPVSRVMSSLDSGWLLLIDEVLSSWGLRRLHYARDLDAVLAYDVRGSTLTLLDIVANPLPPLEAVLGCIPGGFDQVELFFTPDRVWSGEVRLRPSEPEDILMVRGEFPVAEPFMLSPLARC